MKCLVVIAVCCLTACCCADTFNDLVKKYKQTKTRFSIFAADALTGKTYYRINSADPKIPASNMKLITTAAAVHYLGGDYTFKTTVALLNKDLVVIGGGDPLLADAPDSSAFVQSSELLMNKIADALTAAGITEIENIVIDVSFFDITRVHPAWPVDQLNQAYACEVSGLNFCNNCIHIDALRSGNVAVLQMQPQNSYIHLVNQLQLTSRGDSAIGAYRNSVPNKLLMKGKLNKQAGFDVAIENPAGLFASVLCDKLKAKGVAVNGQLLQKYVKNEQSLRSLLVLETPLKDVLKRCNTDSLNLGAECLVKTISAENTQGRINGQWEHGLGMVADYLRSLNIDDSQFILNDGCGLSRNNRLSTECIVAVLKDMYNSQHSQMYFDSLAVGGLEGTVSKYFNEAPYKGNILGKTGYIDGVRAFSGVCKTKNGDLFFSILTEGGNSTARTCINDITKAIFDHRL